MNNGVQDKAFIIYIVAWAILGLVFYLLIKNTENIKKKKKLGVIAGVLISLLMIGFGLIMGLPFGTIPVIIIITGGFIYINYKYTFYCPSCGYSYQRPFSINKFCPKCGAKID